MTLVAAVAAGATLLRVDRALQETSVSGRSDPASHNAPARTEAARLVTEGYAGMVSGHTHEPELSVVGQGFYANTGSGTASVVPRRSRFRLPRPFVAGRPVLLRGTGGRPGPGGGPVAARAAPSQPGAAGAHRPGVGGRPTRPTSRRSASLPAGPTWPLDQAVLVQWVHRRRVRQVAAAVLVVTGILNIVFAFLWRYPRHPALRPLARLRHASALAGRGDGGRPGAVGPGPGDTTGPATGLDRHPGGHPGDDRRPTRPGAAARGVRPRVRVLHLAAPGAPPLPGQPDRRQPPLHLAGRRRTGARRRSRGSRRHLRFEAPDAT